MSVWAGWQKQLAEAAGFRFSEALGEVLYEWHTHAASDCNRNPIDISHRATGATNCKRLTRLRQAKNYPSRNAAAHAFSQQIHSGQFPALLRALNSEHFYQQPNPAAVVRDLQRWGSPRFARYYTNHATRGSGGTPGPGGQTDAPHIHKGWHQLRRSLNRNAPRQLDKAHTLTRQALRAASRGGKV